MKSLSKVFSKRFAVLLGVPTAATLAGSLSLLGSAVETATRSDELAEFVHPPLTADSPYLHSRECEVCHSNSTTATALRDAAGREISPFDLWQSTMMANSARDPLWRAMVAAERDVTPSRSSEIAAACTRCHSPMGSAVREESPTEYLMTPEKLDGNDEIADLGRDGVSCTVCHQIEDVNLGTDETYSGFFPLNDDDEIYGPHDNLIANQMVSRTGKRPVTSTHIRDKSGLCATCHTLFTNAVRADGTATGAVHAEQTPYLEWRNSVFQDEVAPLAPEAASRQDCHVPQLDVDGNVISTRVARNPAGFDWSFLQDRSPYGRHIFVGGNTLIPEILRDNAAALNVTAPAAAFDATIAAARDQLQNRTAVVDVTSAVRSGSQLDVNVQVTNLAGHKLPSGIPTRRVWVRLTVRDSGGNVVWDCGAHDAEGRLVDGFGTPLSSESVGGPILPHLNVVSSEATPVVYEDILEDENGNPVWRLLRADTNFKDNRLLPQGWVPTHPDAPETAPKAINGDPNFVGGGDQISFQIPVGATSGPLTVEATIYFQLLGYRFAQELFAFNHLPDVAVFEGYWQNATRTPETMDTDSVIVP